MKKMNAITLACTSLVLGSALSLPTYADSHSADTNQHQSSDTIENLEQQTSDAWMEGKLDTIYLFNRHLNSFTIDPEVHAGTVILTGKVESEVDRELAEQITLGVDGVKSVTNRLIVVPSEQARTAVTGGNRTLSDKIEDATLTAEVKTKLLANSETHGLSINVDTVDHTVTLSGSVKSSAESDLAETIAKQVDGVANVNNNLHVKS